MNRILYFIKVPPPVTGAALMNKRINESEYLRSKFEIRSICISYSKDVNDLGKIRLNKFLVFINTLIRLVRELLFYKPKFVYFQISPLNISFLRDLCYIFIIRLFFVKITYHIRGQGISKQSKKWIYKVLYKFAFYKSEIICLSNLLTYDIKPVYKGKIHIVNNGIPDFAKEQKRLIENDVVQLLFFSNLILSKGVLEFVSILKSLKQKGINYKAKIVGANGNISAVELKDIIAANDLTEVVSVLGPMYNENKKKILFESDILVFPTNNDAFPGVIIEAMQFGLPVVSTIEGAIPEIIRHEQTGYVIEKKNIEEFSFVLEKLIKDKELRLKMGKASRERYLNHFTFDKFEQNISQTFKNIILNE